jgi:hypothetical protein
MGLACTKPMTAVQFHLKTEGRCGGEPSADFTSTLNGSRSGIVQKSLKNQWRPAMFPSRVFAGLANSKKCCGVSVRPRTDKRAVYIYLLR